MRASLGQARHVRSSALGPKLDHMARSLVDTVHYAREIQCNAHALLEDAQLLFDHGRWARAFALSVLAEEEAGKALLAIAEQLPGDDDFADLKPKRHEDKLTATALAGIAFLGDLGDIQDKARQIDSGALHREKLAALYVDHGPTGLQSPASITCERATQALGRSRELIGWMRAHLGQLTPEAIDAAIQLDAYLTPKMEEYFREHGEAAGLDLVRQMMDWSSAQARGELSTGNASPSAAE